MARNNLIFKGVGYSTLEIATKAVGLILFYSDIEPPPHNREVSPEIIDHSIPWGYFDGAAEGVPVSCGGGAVLNLNDHKWVHLNAGFGSGSDNFAEIKALRLLLISTLEWGVRGLHVFRDSQVVIDWAKGSSKCTIFRLIPILEEISILKSHFNNISFNHVYREQNTIADGLSKEGSQRLEGEESTIHNLNSADGYYHRPYRDFRQR